MNPATRLVQAVTRPERTRRAHVTPISIVVPARNAADTVDRMLESVFQQTSDVWELIVVDDGSTDDTRTRLEAAAVDHRMTILDGPERGVSAARNLGTSVARFTHVLYLDADDRIDDRFVELMGSALTQDPAKAGVRCIWAYETPDGRTQAWDDLDLSDLFASAAGRCPFAIHACVIDRALVQAVGGFDTDLVVGEDWDLWQRIGRAGAELSFVPEVLAYYHLRAESVMHRDLDRMQRDLLEVARRGRRPDPRVPDPIEKYRNGVPPDFSHDHEAEALAGTMAVAVPTDADLASLIPSHPPDEASGITARHVAGALHEAVAFGSCSLLTDWPELYPRHLGRMTEMLDLLSEWLRSPDLTASTLRCLEDFIVRSCDITDMTRIGTTAVETIDISTGIGDIRRDGDEIVQLVAAVAFASIPVGFVRVPMCDGVVAGGVLADAIALELGPRLARLGRTHLRIARALAAAAPRRSLLGSLRRAALDTSWTVGSGQTVIADRFARWLATTTTAALLGRDPIAPSLSPAVDHESDDYGERYFDDIFSEPDPWLYAGNYEQTKYEQTLALLGDRRFGRALELACAEGHFTEQLAPRVDELIAADISPTALARAAERCAEFEHIDYRRIDLRDEHLPQSLDLLVCSEVLYFVESEDGLKDVAKRFAGALAPGGLLVMAHANLVVDDQDLTGFDWEHEFGARRIGEIVAIEPGLRHVSTSVSELYRIHVFERAEPDASEDPGVEIHIEYDRDLDPHIRRMAAWGGVSAIRSDLYETEVSPRIPILMYHRVAPTGHAALDDYRVTPELLESHLNHLRSNGYSAMTMEAWRWAMISHRPPPGRAVMITFDDGYSDFLEHAWPLLRDYDFSSAVFVVADKVGATSDWDAGFGEPAPLMSWDELRFLQGHNVDIVSHSGRHVPAVDVAPCTLLADELRTRARLQAELGGHVRSVAYPFGAQDESVRATFRCAGYDLGFTTVDGFATVWDDPMAIPRINIGMQHDLDTFGHSLAAPAPANPLRRGVRAARRLRTSRR